MAVELVPTPNGPPAKGPYSACVRAGGWTLFAGQVGVDAAGALVEGGTPAETRQIFANLRAMFGDAGVAVSDVAKVTVLLTDIAEFGALNDAYAAFFGEHLPARTTVGVAALPAGAHVEIEVWAHTP